ncbi:hypothetical protein A5724_10715 [Mycobacterium sp. ACS1612]|uniref:EspA/EspE family type VII secretion system effector n=1 Tax=Mycobacterium sp. ACS1612 TaxID=1834117 RepID=UPI0007FD7375|nr:EspA/EspE family type VII secretion system effector [Mycobacterium sp. ACS1612]OBF38187.1 hypothetical protein A5724_10715 [Mycobacterium sp. ACS1612]
MKVNGALFEHGRTVIGGLKDTTGQGVPEPGAAFDRAHRAFDDVNETLKSAAPMGWHGPGAYADQNARQQLRSEAMAGADREVYRVLRREADQIALCRGHLDDQSQFLARTSAASPLHGALRYGEAMKLAVEMAALQSALGESCHRLNHLRSDVAQNAAELQQAVGRYAGVGDAAGLPPRDGR